MKVFISGGCKNGKSSHAQKIAKSQSRDKPLYYLATMVPMDYEDEMRVLRHKKERRGWGFETIEIPRNVDDVIGKCDLEGSFLLDSVTALLANEMFEKKGNIVIDAYEKVASNLKTLLNEIQNIVIVSDFIYSDAFNYDKITEQYKFGLAFIDKEMAKICDVAAEACYGNLLVYKGTEILLPSLRYEPSDTIS